MKILQLCLRVPWPLTDGGNIAMNNLSRLLVASGHDVTVFALNTQKHFVDTSTLAPAAERPFRMVSVPVDTSVTVSGAFKNLFRPHSSYNVSRFYSPEADQRLKELLRKEKYDAVIFESVFTGPYLNTVRTNSTAQCILRTHNVEASIWQRLTGLEKNLLRKRYLKFLTRRLAGYEQRLFKSVDAILPITSVDDRTIASIRPETPRLVVPVGIDTEKYIADPEVNSSVPSIFHIGSMDWKPNEEGVRWFLEACWPLIHTAHPGLQLFLAGKNFPESLLQGIPDGVTVEGFVADAHQFMSGKQIMIVPLHAGSGMRVKILQGLASGKTIISTTIGAEGIDVTDGKDILIADTPQQFLEAITTCVEQPGFAKALGEAGKLLVSDSYSNKRIATKLDDFLKKL